MVVPNKRLKTYCKLGDNMFLTVGYLLSPLAHNLLSFFIFNHVVLIKLHGFKYKSLNNHVKEG